MDGIEPVVVDSPIESSQATATDNLLNPEPISDVSIASILGETESKTAETVDATADDIKKIGESLGRDFSRFKDKESAEAAAAMLIEQYAAIGENTQGDLASMLTPQAAEETGVVETDDLGLDETTVDPAILAVLKKQHAQIKEMRQDSVARQKQQATEQVTGFVKQLEQGAESYLDKLDAPVFGKNGSRNSAQKAASQVVGQIAGNMIKGLIAEARRTGNRNIPTIDTIMGWAVQQTGLHKPAPAAEQTKEKPKAKPHTLPPKAPQGVAKAAKRFRVSESNDPAGIFSSNDPVINAIWAEAMG